MKIEQRREVCHFKRSNKFIGDCELLTNNKFYRAASVSEIRMKLLNFTSRVWIWNIEMASAQMGFKDS